MTCSGLVRDFENPIVCGCEPDFESSFVPTYPIGDKTFSCPLCGKLFDVETLNKDN